MGLWVSVWDSDGTAHGRRWIRVPGVAVEHMGLAEWTLPQKGASHYEDGTVGLLRSHLRRCDERSPHIKVGIISPSCSGRGCHLLDRGSRATPYYQGRAPPSGCVCLSPLPPAACAHRLTAPTGLYHHVRYVSLDNVAVPVIVEQRGGAGWWAHSMNSLWWCLQLC